MPIRYSGAAYYASFTPSGRADLADSLKSALVSAGWTVASGSSGNWKLDSASTPSGHRIRVRIYDPGGTNVCARLRLMTVDESIAPALDVFLRPGLRYVVLACPYQFFCFAPGTVDPRTFAAGGVPWIPGFLNPAHVGWLQGNAQSDTDASSRRSFRSSDAGPFASAVSQISIYGTTGWSDATTANPAGAQGLVVLVDGGLNYAPVQWFSGHGLVSDPLIAWGLASPGDVSVVIGQLWDSFIVYGNWRLGAGMDRILSYDGRQWWCVYYQYYDLDMTLAVLVP